MKESSLAAQLKQSLARVSPVVVAGKVSAVQGLLIECSGLASQLSIGGRCRVYPAQVATDAGSLVEPSLCEVVGFRDETALLMPFETTAGIGLGSRVEAVSSEAAIYPSEDWLGRIVNALGEPVDDKGGLPQGSEPIPLRNNPPSAHQRQRVKGKLELGVRVLNTFTTCCEGQRMGIFAGSGVGKSIMMSMLAKNAGADVNVIGLIGERSRELQEFIEDALGEEGLARSVLVVATSSESALMRRQAAYMTMSVAEYFRNQGQQVLLLMDSVTRFAMAQREIGLSAGEPPTSKGYTPTVFTELPHLLERAGPGVEGQGGITGLFTVLVEGDDTNEPISDAVRGILDGHIIMDRSIGERGRYPAVNVLKSVSRTMPDCNTDAQNALLREARKHLSTYEDMAEMIRLGAYRRGSDEAVDKAMDLVPQIEAFLTQGKNEFSSLEEGYQQLAGILGMQYP